MADNSIAVVDVNSAATLWTTPKPRSGYSYTYVSLSPDGKFVGAILTNGTQTPEPAQVNSQLVIWRITPAGRYAVVLLRNTALPVEGFEFGDDDNTVIAWLTVYGHLRFWLLDMTTLKPPLSLPREWGKSSVVAYNLSLNKLIIEQETGFQPSNPSTDLYGSTCGWVVAGLHAGGLVYRTINLATFACGGLPGQALSTDGSLFASTGGKKALTVSIWSVTGLRKVQSWQLDVQFYGNVAFFDGSRGLAEVHGSQDGINLVTKVDLYRVRDHKIVAQYTLRPVPHWSSELTSLEVVGGVLVAIEPIGERDTYQGSLESYAYYALPLPVLN